MGNSYAQPPYPWEETAETAVVKWETSLISGKWSRLPNEPMPPQLHGRVDPALWNDLVTQIATDLGQLLKKLATAAHMLIGVGLVAFAVSIASTFNDEESLGPGVVVFVVFPLLLLVGGLNYGAWHVADTRADRIVRLLHPHFEAHGCSLAYSSERVRVSRRATRKIAWFAVRLLQPNYAHQPIAMAQAYQLQGQPIVVQGYPQHAAPPPVVQRYPQHATQPPVVQGYPQHAAQPSVVQGAVVFVHGSAISAAPQPEGPPPAYRPPSGGQAVATSTPTMAMPSGK
jgi:hypothetical protein